LRPGRRRKKKPKMAIDGQGALATGKDSRQRALVLSGGGGRGAYHIGVLAFLERHDWSPDIIVGTSIGAVNGAALASGHNAHSLWALWRRLETKDVQRQNWAILDPSRWDHLLDTAPLRETLIRDKWIDVERINAAEPEKHLRITAIEVDTGRLRVFGNSSDLYPSRMEQTPLTVDHILASCSIPVIYPPTVLEGVRYWDGGTVANTPLGPALDAGAEDIVVVIMTPWEEDDTPGAQQVDAGIKGLLTAGAAAFEWALLASFQTDLKLFKRVNEVVRLKVENARLRAENAYLKAVAEGEKVAYPVDADGDGVPDILQRQVREPIIIAPRRLFPMEQIIQYRPEKSKKLYESGYADAERAWRAAGRPVEGG